MTTETFSIGEALEKLQELAPDAPFLALGQTIFWDEPMKGGIALASRRLGYKRRFVAGIHDTDYFAKLPAGRPQSGRFLAFPHNDTSTRGLWSAAAEFSALFGSETVVTREALAASGLRIGKLLKARPNFLDDATEAWGWRGIVSLDEHAPITAEVPLHQVFPTLHETLDWALGLSMESLAGESRAAGQELVERLRSMMCDRAETDQVRNLSDLYKSLLPEIYSAVANVPVELEATATTELLRFNSASCGLPRFDLLRLFVEPGTRENACQAYDEAIQGSGQYPVSRFGTGAIPFDLVIPGKGRGTIRIANRAILIMTAAPQFISLKRPITSVVELANAIETKFGPECVLIGKAVTLIGMLAREFVFVFHEGASGYLGRSRTMHQKLAAEGHPLALNPVLRAKYSVWDSLSVCCCWLRLPDIFQRAFGTEEVCAPSFSARWKEVSQEQEELLARLGTLRRPIELIRYLDSSLGGSWNKLAQEYRDLHGRLEGLMKLVAEVRSKRAGLYDQIRGLKRQRITDEKELGDHFRARVFEKPATIENREERERLKDKLGATIDEMLEARRKLKTAMRRQNDVVADPATLRVHERRRAIELEAELKRVNLIRSAITTAKGLAKANHRPSAWWFPLVCPDGLWFRQTIDSAQYYLEPLN